MSSNTIYIFLAQQFVHPVNEITAEAIDILHVFVHIYDQLLDPLLDSSVEIILDPRITHNLRCL